MPAARHLPDRTDVAADIAEQIELASEPGEYDTGTEAAGAAAPINLTRSCKTPADTMTYEIFEATVEHGDLPECPAALAAESRFRRVVLQNDMLHVFAFSQDGDQGRLSPVEAD